MFDSPTAEELRAFLKAHGLTGSATADLVGVDSRTVRKWTASDGSPNSRTMPWSAWALLNLRVTQGPVEVEQVLEGMKKPPF